MRHNGLCSLSNKWHDKQSHSFKWKQEALQLRRYFKTSKFIKKTKRKKKNVFGNVIFKKCRQSTA